MFLAFKNLDSGIVPEIYHYSFFEENKALCFQGGRLSFTQNHAVETICIRSEIVLDLFYTSNSFSQYPCLKKERNNIYVSIIH